MLLFLLQSPDLVTIGPAESVIARVVGRRGVILDVAYAIALEEARTQR